MINNVDAEECHRCKNRMYSYLSSDTFEGRCVPLLTHGLNYWSSTSKEECKRFPNQYSVGSICFYCAGTWDASTGVCSTTDCHRDRTSKRIYGLSENDCIRCGGEFSMANSGGEKVGKCDKDSYWD